jgi:hypothetical protein
MIWDRSTAQRATVVQEDVARRSPRSTWHGSRPIGTRCAPQGERSWPCEAASAPCHPGGRQRAPRPSGARCGPAPPALRSHPRVLSACRPRWTPPLVKLNRREHPGIAMSYHVEHRAGCTGIRDIYWAAWSILVKASPPSVTPTSPIVKFTTARHSLQYSSALV